MQYFCISQEFVWPLSSPIIDEDISELFLYNKGAFFSDK